MSVVGLFACWQCWFGHHRNGDIWMVVPHCLMWCIWKERNSRCFEDIEHSMPNIKLLFFKTLLDWFSVWRNHPFSSILDLLDFCNVHSWFVHPYILPVYLGVSLFLLSMNLYYLSKKKKRKEKKTNDQISQAIEKWSWRCSTDSPLFMNYSTNLLLPYFTSRDYPLSKFYQILLPK